MSDQVEKLRAELDAIDDWNESQKRAFELYEQFGVDAFTAAKGTYRPNDRWFDLNSVPDDCPWQIPTNESDQAIDILFGGLANEIPGFINALKETCRVILAHRDDNGRWRLNYYLERTRSDACCVTDPEGSNQVIYMMGGPPNDSPKFHPSAEAAGWAEVPNQLVRWSAIHDGFGDELSDWGVGTILPVDRMEPLGDSYPHWLDIYCDDVGDRVVLPRESADKSLVMEWDHETHETGEPFSFFRYLNHDWAIEILDLDPWEYRDKDPFA